MKQLLLAALLCAAFSVNAQIQGVIKDAADNPLAAATVILLKATDSAVIKTAVTQSNGSYSIEAAPPGRYLIRASSSGFREAVSAPFDFSGAIVSVPVVLDRKSGNLSQVVIRTTKPVIEVKADKMIFNVEANSSATGMDGIELLRISPGVLVDHEDNISITGKSGVQVFIDGKPSPLSGRDLSNYLRSLRANAIEAIEIINNPSAKYDAAGTGGIINIRLKKSSSFGTNGSVSSNYQQGKWARFNNGIALNNRNRLVNVFGNYNYNNARNEFDLDVYRHVLDSVFDGYTASVTHNRSHNYKAGVDRFLNKHNTIGVLVSGIISNDRNATDGITYIGGDNSSSIDRILVSDNRSTAVRNTLNANINYQYNKSGTTLNMDADYGSFRLRNEQYQPNEFYDGTRTNLLGSRNYTMVTPSDIDIWSFKADYERDWLKGRLAVGMKSAFINSDNSFISYNHTSAKLEYDSVLSNHFLYRENINAVYASFNKSVSHVQFMIGLRAEQTITKGTSTGHKKNGSGFAEYNEQFTRRWLNLFPSGNITFAKNPLNQWTLSYSRRINRPSYQDLNPFEKRASEYGGFKGNPALKPEFANTFSLVNVYKTRLVTSLSFTIIDNVIVSISDTLNGTKSFYAPKNLARQRNVSLNSNYTFTKGKFTLTTGATGFYTHNRADFGPGREVDLEVVALTCFAQPNLKFGKGWSANLHGMFESPKLFRGTMKQRSFYMMNMGVQKMFFNDRATARVNFNDVFRTAEFFGTSDFAGQYLTAYAWWDPRRVVASFTYRFGSSQVKSTRQRKTGIDDEAGRATTGGN
ncbi:MAG TPA: TonB-dependent receptor [Flavisolibacter sp.]